MNTKKNVTWKQKLDFILFGWIINLAYPEYYRPRYGYLPYRKLFFFYFIPQKIFRINGRVPWPVHFTSRVLAYKMITKGILCDPGDNNGLYIQANSGIRIGNNVGFGAGTAIVSSNHNHNDHSKHDIVAPIVIGNNVFVGANAVILPGVQIGDNVVIGAGSVVTKNIPSNSIAVGNPCVVIKKKEAYAEDFSKIKFNKPLPNHLSEIYSSL